MDNKQIAAISPDWFKAKSEEVKGAGYPSLVDVPQPRPLPGLNSFDG